MIIGMFESAVLDEVKREIGRRAAMGESRADEEKGLPQLYIEVDELMTKAGVAHQMGNHVEAYAFAKEAAAIQVAMLVQLKRLAFVAGGRS